MLEFGFAYFGFLGGGDSHAVFDILAEDFGGCVGRDVLLFEEAVAAGRLALQQATNSLDIDVAGIPIGPRLDHMFQAGIADVMLLFMEVEVDVIGMWMRSAVDGL